MSKEENNNASVNTGSADDLIQSDPLDLNGGESEETSGNKLQEQYTALEKKLGEQGNELGDLRNFFEEVEPLMDKLQEQPELVEAIMSGKVDTDLAQAVLSNKVKIEDAAIVTEAHKEVKTNLGNTKYKNTSSEDIEKMINEKISKVSNDFKQNIKSSEDRGKFEKSVERFIGETEDFSVYAKGVTEWLDKHTDIYDIETAYYAVKGKALAAEKSKENDSAMGEAAKRLAMNAGGGSQGGKIVQDKSVVDSLISGVSNPNSFD